MNWPAVTFLSPVAGLIAAGIAVPVLLLWYFLKLRRRPVRISSTLLWQQAVQDLQVNAPFRWLRPSWLLLLQLLLLAALVGAIARPALDLPGEPPERMILVIDRSASMSSRDVAAAGGDVNNTAARVTRLDDAKRQAKELVARLSGRSRAMIITMAAQPEVVANYSRDRSALANAIDAIEPTDQPADPGALWRVVEAFAVGGDDAGAEAGGSPASRAAVVLFSDGALRRAPGMGDGIGPASLRFIRCAPPEEAPADNLAIVGFNARRAYDDPATLQVFVRVQSVNAATTPIDAALTLSLNGEVIDGSALALPTDASTDTPASVTRTFNFQNTEGGLLTAAIARGDSLPADNAASLLLRPPGAPRILLVQPNEPNARADQVLQDGLSWFKPRELARVRLAEYERASAAAGSSPGVNPGAFDLLVFDRVRPARLPPGGKPTLSFGAGLPIAGLSVEPYAPDDAAGASTGFAFWQRTHPVMRYVSLNAVTVFRPLNITPPAEGPRADGGPITSTALASGASGPLILLLEGGAASGGGASARRIIVGFSPTDSWWFKELSFPVFLKNAVDYLTLTGDESAGRGFTTVEAVTVAPIAGAREVSASGPVTLRRVVPPEGAPRLSLGILPRAGVYELDGATAADADSPRVPVNLLDEWESRIGSASSIDAAGSSTPATGIGSAAPREIWHWLVALAAGLLLIEWLLFAWRMRV